MGGGAAEVLLGHLLVGDGADDLRAGDEHVARLLDHQDEVGDRRRVHRAAGARPHDGGDLRHHAGGERVAQEDVGVAAERRHPLLDAGAAGVVEADDRRPVVHRQVHQLADLGGVGLRQRAAEDGEVLGEDVDQPAVDGAVAADHAVAGDAALGHPEVGAAVGDQRIDLDERAGVEQQLHPLAGGQLAGGVLLVDALLAAAQAGALEAVLQLGQGFALGRGRRRRLRLRGIGHGCQAYLSRRRGSTSGRRRHARSGALTIDSPWRRPDATQHPPPRSANSRSPSSTAPPWRARCRSSPTARATSPTPGSSAARRWSCRPRTGRRACGCAARRGWRCACCAPASPRPRPAARRPRRLRDVDGGTRRGR